MSKFVNYGNILHTIVCENPLITFVLMERKMENVDGANVNKVEFIKLEFFMDSSSPDSKDAHHFVIFKNECAEEWVK
jgi:hypothetical protein